MKKLGIVGGTSWTSTALYYEHINRGVAQRLGGLHSACLAIESFDFAPMAAMQKSGDWAGVARVGAEAGKRLAGSGAQGLILASNTLHKVSAEIAAASDLPILNIAEVTADKIVADGRRLRAAGHGLHDERGLCPTATRIAGCRSIPLRLSGRVRSTASSTKNSPRAALCAGASAN